MKSTICVVAFCGILALPGCGSSGDESSSSETTSSETTTTPSEAANTGPRVDGEWRVVLTSRGRDSSEDRFTWETTPECPAGACSFRVESKTTGNRFRFKFDEALEDYLRRYRYTDDCVNIDTGEVLVSNAYRVSVVDQLNVVDSVIAAADGVDYATQMIGTSEEDPVVTPEAEAASCAVKDATYDLLAIRTDEPVGEPGSAASPIEGAEGDTGAVPAGE